MDLQKNARHHGFWSKFTSKIQQIGFGDIMEDEEEVIVKIYRRMLFRALMRTFIWFSAFVYSGVLWMWFFWNSIWMYIGLVAIAYGFYRMFYTFSYWYLNAIVMTTHNLIFVHWEKFFHRKTSRLDYWNLDEIEVERTGISSYLYHYGTLHFYKASGGELYSFSQCHAPNHAAREIEQFKQRLMDHKNFSEESTLKGLLSGIVQRHMNVEGIELKKGQFVEAEDHGKKFKATMEKLEKKGIPQRPDSNNDGGDKKSAMSRWRKKASEDEVEIEVEKKFDDEGGVSIDL